MYNLKAVALHGGSVDYGHYIALAKRDQNVDYLKFKIIKEKIMIVVLFR